MQIKVILGGVFASLAVAATLLHAQVQPRLRMHTETQAATVTQVPAVAKVSNGSVSWSKTGSGYLMSANGLPSHAVGTFPNAGNPHRITAQSYKFTIKSPSGTGNARELSRSTLFGVAVNGVPFDPGAAEFWQGNPDLGWQYEALGGAVTLGLDVNFGHVQPSGAYHYHGLPVGLLQQLNWRSDGASPLIGYAADGFPIYAITAERNGRIVQMHSSYQLKSGQRPGGRYPSGVYDGAFVQDYEYIAGSGDLDQCNGAYIKNDAYPNGTYAYFLTQDYPVIPRCHMGKADRSFAKRR